MFNAEEALKIIEVAAEQKLQLHFRVKNIPESQRVLIRKIRANRLGTFIAVEGLVKKITEMGQTIWWRKKNAIANIRSNSSN